MVAVQKTFQKQVKSLCATIEETGNPFQELSNDLSVLDTRDVVDESVIETVKSIEKIGKAQYEMFVSERLQERKVSLFDTIKRNKLAQFSSPPPTKEKSKDKMQITSLRSNCFLFVRLYVSCRFGTVIWMVS